MKFGAAWLPLKMIMNKFASVIRGNKLGMLSERSKIAKNRGF
jgi:hypothetical protein